jgi:hypothetical protein
MSDAAIQHAFVSYVREDADAVDQLVSALQAASIPVWKDTENLWPGEDWQQKIREAIEDGSLAFIACFSTSSVQKAKTYMNAELNLAVEQIRLMRPGHVWLLPVRLDDCELPRFDLDASRTLDSLQRIDLFGPKRETNLARLVAAVMAIFGTSTTTPASAAAAIAGSRDIERGPLLADGKALLTDAERIAQSIGDNPPEFSPHIRIVRATDPDRDGLHAAQSTTDDSKNVFMLASFAEALAATDPDRAARLIADAERTAQSITDDSLKASALASIAEARAATGLDP